MPIEFHCPQCSKLLRTPDESAGKRARCPHCSTVADVPGGSPSAPDKEASGFAFGSESDDFGSSEAFPFADPPLGGDSMNPYSAPASGSTMGAYGETLGPDARKGLPWERLGKSLGTFWSTVKLVMSSPTHAFGAMRREGGLGEPMGYALIGGFIGAMATAIYNAVLQGTLFGVMGMQQDGGGGGEVALGVGVQIAVQIFGGLVAGTIGVVMGLFISTCLYHVFLMMLGATRLPHQTFETTFRVVAYVTGTVSLLQVIPLCGQYVYGLVGLIYMILGISAAHEISGGKAAAAVLLPIVLCVVVIGVVVGALVATIAVQAQSFLG